MPRALRINGRAAVLNGRRLTDANGAPCCCGGGEEPPPPGLPCCLRPINQDQGLWTHELSPACGRPCGTTIDIKRLRSLHTYTATYQDTLVTASITSVLLIEIADDFPPFLACRRVLTHVSTTHRYRQENPLGGPPIIDDWDQGAGGPLVMRSDIGQVPGSFVGRVRGQLQPRQFGVSPCGPGGWRCELTPSQQTQYRWEFENEWTGGREELEALQAPTFVYQGQWTHAVLAACPGGTPALTAPDCPGCGDNVRSLLDL
jgi:hypothetical protein